MKLKTNFGKIDSIIKEIPFENKYAIINYITNAVYNELSNVFAQIESQENKDTIEELESIIVNVQKDSRGFKGFSYYAKDQDRKLSLKKGTNCYLPDDTIIEFVQILNTEVLNTEESMDNFIANPIPHECSKITEKDLENIIIKDLSIVEEGMILIDNQHPIQDGFIDILARDKFGKLCIIELKKVKNDSKIIQQCVYYPTQFDEDLRMITIAPDYSNKISKSLQSLSYVEMKIYSFEDDVLTVRDY